MGAFLVRTLLQRILLLVVISFIANAVIHLAPGEPSEVDPMNPMMKPEDVARIRATFHLDEPVYKQYIYWVRDLASGQLTSFKTGRPVLTMIWERFLNSVPLFLLATIIVWTISFPTGIRAAVTRGSRYDRSTTLLAYALISIPSFFLAYILVIWISGSLHIPVIGLRTFGIEGVSVWHKMMDRLWHLVVPSLMSAIMGVAILSRYVRTQMLEVIGSDFVRTARAKGLPETEVIYKHALRNAMLPFITMFGLLLPGLIGGSVIVEQIFAWPGIGRLGYEAILTRDFPVILTLNFFAAVLTISGTLLSDILYAFADPRIKLGTE